MSEPYLILHKVRGEPAFDIAIQWGEGTESDPGPWWIIPTSGHRAYPYGYARLNSIELHELLCGHVTMPDDWPDHYQCTKEHPKPTGIGRALLAKLGLIEKERRRA